MIQLKTDDRGNLNSLLLQRRKLLKTPFQMNKNKSIQIFTFLIIILFINYYRLVFILILIYGFSKQIIKFRGKK